MNKGESIKLSLKLQNSGARKANGVIAEISCLSPYVSNMINLGPKSFYNNGWDSYVRTSNSGCWSSPTSVGGSTTITDNTPDELIAVTSNILASNVFSGDDLQILTDAGYTYISISQAYLHTSSTLISFAQIFYAGDFEVELLTISGNFGKQSSTSFSTCKFTSENIIHNISIEAKGKLKHQTIMQIKK